MEATIKQITSQAGSINFKNLLNKVTEATGADFYDIVEGIEQAVATGAINQEAAVELDADGYPVAGSLELAYTA